MDRIKRYFMPVLLLIGSILVTWVVAASAQAYLHVSAAQDYARAHVWRTFCSSSGRVCADYPRPTSYVRRYSANYVRIEIYVYRYGSGACTRVFAVKGNDGASYISTDGSSPFYYCT